MADRQVEGLGERAGRSGVVAGAAKPGSQLDEDGRATLVCREQRRCPPQKRDRADVGGLCGSDPGAGEPAACDLGEPRQLRIPGVQPGAIVVRLCEMPSDQLVRPRAVPVEPRRRALVQRGADALRKRAVGDVAQ